jgi:thioredoxin-like negative regulator of GroEL
LSVLAKQHLETRFVKINAEKSPFLVERLGIFIMPTILLIKDGQTIDKLVPALLSSFFIAHSPFLCPQQNRRV